MYTVRRFQNFNPEIEKEAKAEQKAKAKAEEKQYKVHLEQLRKDNEEDVASSKLGVAPRGALHGGGGRRSILLAARCFSFRT